MPAGLNIIHATISIYRSTYLQTYEIIALFKAVNFEKPNKTLILQTLNSLLYKDLRGAKRFIPNKSHTKHLFSNTYKDIRIGIRYMIY